jgi:ribonuclease D
VTAPEVVVDQARFDALVDHLCTCDRYAVDTEFHRERTYFPRLALLQVAWADGLVLVDPFEVDLRPLARLFTSEALAVLHAAEQDLEVLEAACSAIPCRIFDTQVAAGFLGLSSPSLALLHSHYLGRRLPKGDRLTDWLARPLRASQVEYAASDVEHLLELHDRLLEELDKAGRTEWVAAECEELRRRDRSPRDPHQAWTRIKEARQLRGKKLAVAQELAAWREERAQERDLPPRFVIPDLVVVSVAQRLPGSTDDLRGTRGVEDRYLRNGVSRHILSAVERGLERGEPWPAPTVDGELERRLRPAASLVSAWIAQQARDLDLDVAVLATRGDIEAFLRDRGGRLAQGWRADVAGDGIERLVSGRASLAFDGNGHLVLEERSVTT